MSGALLLASSLVLLILAYAFYGRWVAGKFGIDDRIVTPAHRLKDDVDYVPAPAPVLLGHHFASIAGAAPIIGPISAAVFGWIPVLLWLLLGGIFFGAMHDFAALFVSVRNDGRSMGEVIKKHVGSKGSILFLLFTWFALALVIAAFSIIVAKTFVTVPAAASSSVLFIGLAIVFGLALNRFRFSLASSTIVGVALLFLMIWLGQVYPLQTSENIWLYILILYVYVASVAPVWLLLQPRDYLNSFLLYLLLIAGFIGMLCYNPELKFPAFTAFKADSLGYLFPMLFVTVACGAISGFHALVASGTTAKQLNRESDAQPVAFGGMLIETLLGILALLTAVMLTSDIYAADLAAKGPVGVFAAGMANAISSIPGLNLNQDVLVSLVSLIVSAFALTSLDTATRLGRFAFQELADFFPENVQKPFKNSHVATVMTILPAAVMMFSGQWKAIWPVFGSANQLLASIALLSVTVWYFHNFGKKPLFIIIPMVTMFLVTCFALVNMIESNLASQGYLLAGLSGILLLLALFLAWEAGSILLKKHDQTHEL
ncbi:MAG: carbon starvation protein A [Candidatus Rifleibacteriota bacterium]